MPHFEGKHLHEALYRPEDVIERWAKTDQLPETPSGVILCWDKLLPGWLGQELGARPITWNRMLQCQLHAFSAPGLVAAFMLGWGAPAATYVLELLIALGTKRFVLAGTAGGFGPGMQIGDVVLCDRAIRDEGVSHHYLEPGKYSYPSQGLSAGLASALTDAGVTFQTGATWTLDALFRETAAEVRHHLADGALTVEMEAAALFAVAHVRGVEIAAAFAVSDLLLEDRHVPPNPGSYTRALQGVFQAATTALA